MNNQKTSVNPNIDPLNDLGILQSNINIADNETPTSLNPNIDNDETPTALNPNIDNGETPTALNPNLIHDTSMTDQTILRPGQIVNQYRIIKLLSKSGEAEVYQCEKDEEDFVIKLYLKHLSLKNEIRELLVGKSLGPNLANMCEVDDYSFKTENGSTFRYTYEVEPFYNTINTVLPFREIKKLINDINEGMHVLHTLSETIIHKDIKPANIMMDHDGNYLLIDFGISSVIDKGMTSLKTSTGLTFEYAAPESRISNRFSIATDYYSFGITLYHLYTGELPYANSNDRLDLLIRHGVVVAEDIGMPQSLVELIQGLTFYNSNPDINRKRWGYDEVKRWLDGDSTLEVPAYQIISHTNDYTSGDQMPPYIFKGVTYTNRLEFVIALAENWEEGKKALFHGIISAHYKKIGNQTLLQYCMDAEDEQGSGNDDLVYYRFLYQIEPRLEKIYWKEKSYTEAEFAREKILVPLWRCNGAFDLSTLPSTLATIKDVQKNNFLTIFYGKQDTSNPYYVLAKDFETSSDNNITDTIYLYYSMAYQMMGVKLFRLHDKLFTDFNEFADYLKDTLEHNIDDYFTICDSLYGRDFQLDFYCWMKSLGMEEQINNLAM